MAVRRLAEPLPPEPVARLMDRVAGLGHRLDVVLLQLPPTLRCDVDLLSECLGQFPAGTRVAVEPRHESWWTDDVRALLERYAAALCEADRGEQPVAPLWRTAEWGHLRLRTGAQGWGYRPAAPQLWAQRPSDTYGDDDVLEFSNDDPGGAATVDAVTFAEAVRTTGREHTRGPTMAEVSGTAWPPEPPPRQRTAGSSANVTPS